MMMTSNWSRASFRIWLRRKGELAALVVMPRREDPHAPAPAPTGTLPG